MFSPPTDFLPPPLKNDIKSQQQTNKRQLMTLSISSTSVFKNITPLLKPLLTLAGPVIASQAASMMVNVADTLMVSDLGDAPLAAISFTGNLFVPLMFLGIGMASTLTPLVGRRLGRGNITDIAAIVAHARKLNWCLSALLVSILLLLTVLVPFMGQPQEVVEMAQILLPLYAFSLLGQQMFVCSRTLIEGLQDTRSPMVIGIASNVLNVILNYVFIFGIGPYEGIGVYGAALSTLIARILMWLALEVVLRRRLRRMGIRPHTVRGHSLSLRLARIGLPLGLQSLAEAIGFALAGIMIGWISLEAIAAHQVVNLFCSLTYLMAGGLATAITIKVSVSMGEGSHDVARRYAVAGISLAAIFMLCAALVLIVFRHHLPALFLHNDASLAIAAQIMMVGGLFELFDGLQVTTIGALRGFADFAYPARVATLAFALTSSPVGYVLAFVLGMGPSGIWFGMAAGLVLAAVLLLHRLRHKFFATQGIAVS